MSPPNFMTNFISISSIFPPTNRQRKEFPPSKLRELADSIENPSIGLLHPVVLREHEGQFILVAGERRMRSISDSHELGVQPFFCGQPIPQGMIPYTTLGQMTPLSAWEAELEENVQREDLTWQERAKAREELYRLRQAQAAERGEPLPSRLDVAEEITGKREGGTFSKAADEIRLAKHLDDPEVRAAATPKEALRVLEKKDAAARHERLARELGPDFKSSEHYLYRADSKEWFETCLPHAYDVILTDPPYGMGADDFNDSGTGGSAGAHGYSDSAEVLEKILLWFPQESFRTTKPQAHLYVFLDFQHWQPWQRALIQAGWKVFRTPLIWHKPNGFRVPWVGKGPQRRYELCLFAVKGDKPTLKVAGDVLTYPVNDDEKLGHMAQKPIALYKDLLSRSAMPGDRVLDPFCGSGPIFSAAHELKCRATGVEIDEVVYGIARKRLKELK